MYMAKVRGTVVSVQKNPHLVGFKLLITQPIGDDGAYIGNPSVSVDTVGAGTGETVLIATGSTARFASGDSDAPIDSTIVGIVDSTEIDA